MTARSILVALLVAGCMPQPVPDKPRPPRPEERDMCTAFCEMCPGQGSPGKDEVYGTDDDVPCSKSCADIVSAEVGYESGGRDCLDTAADCGAAEGCLFGD